jgi:hypothetical protein
LRPRQRIAAELPGQVVHQTLARRSELIVQTADSIDGIVASGPARHRVIASIQ